MRGLVNTLAKAPWLLRQLIVGVLVIIVVGSVFQAPEFMKQQSYIDSQD